MVGTEQVVYACLRDCAFPAQGRDLVHAKLLAFIDKRLEHSYGAVVEKKALLSSAEPPNSAMLNGPLPFLGQRLFPVTGLAAHRSENYQTWCVGPHFYCPKPGAGW